MNATRLFLIGLLTASNYALAETAYVNANGYTSSDRGIIQFSVMVVDDDGRIVATGDESVASEFTGATVVDVDGKTLLPGLTDGHAHVLGLGLLKSNVDLTGIESVEAAVDVIARYAADNPDKRWITGRGWNQVLWPVKEFPTAADIDAVVSDRPVFLDRIDGHAGWANTKALELAGITDDSPDPVGGKILRGDNGHATGVLIDRAMSSVYAAIPAANQSDLRDAIAAAVDAVAAEGITSVHDAGISLENAEMYLSMADDNALDIRISAMTAGAGDILDAIGKPIRGYGNDHLDIAAVKIVSDGALGSRGAAMIEPYSDDAENRGLPFWTQSELDAQVKKANDMGFQVGVHAIGDLGNRMVLDAFEKAQGGKPSPYRNRVEHAQIVTLSDIPRFAELGVIASMQATHATSDMNMAEDRIGPDRILGGYAWRRMLDSGAVIANGSDFPVELSNPFHGLYASVTRKARNGQPSEGWYADQALTRAESLHSFTLAAAYAAHQEDRLGSLEPGKWADFIIIDRDYFKVPEDQIDDIKVLKTYVGGKVIYDAADDGEQQ